MVSETEWWCGTNSTHGGCGDVAIGGTWIHFGSESRLTHDHHRSWLTIAWSMKNWWNGKQGKGRPMAFIGNAPRLVRANFAMYKSPWRLTSVRWKQRRCCRPDCWSCDGAARLKIRSVGDLCNNDSRQHTSFGVRRTPYIVCNLTSWWNLTTASLSCMWCMCASLHVVVSHCYAPQGIWFDIWHTIAVALSNVLCLLSHWWSRVEVWQGCKIGTLYIHVHCGPTHPAVSAAECQH